MDKPKELKAKAKEILMVPEMKFDPENNNVKAFCAVKETRTKEINLFALTYNGKILEKRGREDWRQTYPKLS